MPTLLERRTVSRKTPRDGKLEITRRAAAALLPLQGGLRVSWDGAHAAATVDTMRCTCGGEDNPHEHYFVQSDVLKALEVGADVDLTLDARERVLTVTRAS